VKDESFVEELVEGSAIAGGDCREYRLLGGEERLQFLFFAHGETGYRVVEDSTQLSALRQPIGRRRASSARNARAGSPAQDVMGGRNMRASFRSGRWVPAIAVVAAGCIHEHTVVSLQPGATSGDAVARLADGREVPVRATPDGESILWVARSGATIDAADMTSYSTTDRARGALEGMGLGLLGGAAIGAGVGYATGTSCHCWFSPASTAFGFGVILGGIGLIGGGIGGLISGSQDVYRLGPKRARTPRVSASIQPGGGNLSWTF